MSLLRAINYGSFFLSGEGFKFWGPASQWEAKTCHLGIGFGLRILADQAFGFSFQTILYNFDVLNCFRILEQRELLSSIT